MMNPEFCFVFFRTTEKRGPFVLLELVSWLAINLEVLVTSLANEVMRGGKGGFCWA